jgi:cytochrome P450
VVAGIYCRSLSVLSSITRDRPDAPDTPLGLYVASRHADVSEILRDKRFGKDFIGRITRRSGAQILEEPVYRSMSHWMLQLDPPDHGRLRGLVVRAFTARRIEDMRSRIQQIVDEIIDHVEPRGRMDLIADFAFRLPVTVISDMLGIPAGGPAGLLY